MKKVSLKLVSLLLALVLAICAASPAFAAVSNPNELRFNSDGSFTILQFADTQDDMLASPGMIAMLEAAMDKHQPDLVVFTGDNIGGTNLFGAAWGIQKIIAPVVERNLPFAIVFGNHDGERSAGKELQLRIYQRFDGCLAYDADPEMYGCATYNLPIKSSDGSRDAFNLWMIDSNMYNEDESIGGYDYVHQDQIDWYVKTSKALEVTNGGLVPSLAFQHIIVPEIFELMEPVPAGVTPDEATGGYNGQNYYLRFAQGVDAQGVINERPCPSNVNGGEVAAMLERGDVIGMAFGHDHVNNFVADYRGIDLIQTPGAGFESYGSDDVRGYRVIELNENDPWNYETETYTFFDLFGESDLTQQYARFAAGDAENVLLGFLLVLKILVPLAVTVLTGYLRGISIIF